MDLSKLKDWEQEKLAENPDTSKDILQELSKEKDWVIRDSVAENPNTSGDTLKELTQKEEEEIVKCTIARNPNTPEDALWYLAKDEDEDVRWHVANNPNASSKILVMQFEYEKSLREPDDNVIRALHTHKNLPAFAKRVIETLFKEIL